MCREGRIEGAARFGKYWAIPIDAEKPLDHRITSGQYKNWREKIINRSDKVVSDNIHSQTVKRA